MFDYNKLCRVADAGKTHHPTVARAIVATVQEYHEQVVAPLEKRLDELERKQDHKHNQWTGKPQYLKPDQPPERPEPKFKVPCRVRGRSGDEYEVTDVKERDNLRATPGTYHYWRGGLCRISECDIDCVVRDGPEHPITYGFRVGDWVKDSADQVWQISAVDKHGNITGGGLDGYYNPIHYKPATPQECLCEPRKRDEEAKTIYFPTKNKPIRASFRQDKELEWSLQWNVYTKCIHCNRPIKRSLLEE